MTLNPQQHDASPADMWERHIHTVASLQGDSLVDKLEWAREEIERLETRVLDLKNMLRVVAILDQGKTD